MTLDDLLIYGDWLEENYIKNEVYKRFLNLLRVILRRNDQYGRGLGRSVVDYGVGYINGGGFGDGNGYGNHKGNGYGIGRPGHYGYDDGWGLGLKTGNTVGDGNGISI